MREGGTEGEGRSEGGEVRGRDAGKLTLAKARYPTRVTVGHGVPNPLNW